MAKVVDCARTGGGSDFWHVQDQSGFSDPYCMQTTYCNNVNLLYVVTKGTNGSQMKDMDLIFPLIPYGSL